MTEAEEKVSIPYRIPGSQHRRFKAAAAERGMSMQEMIDAAVADYLKEGAVARPKDLREAHALLDLLYENRSFSSFETYLQVVLKLLRLLPDELSKRK